SPASELSGINGLGNGHPATDLINNASFYIPQARQRRQKPPSATHDANRSNIHRIRRHILV
ncbi:hypothetical protein ACV1EH_13280, partial [Aeromonas caviae]